MLGEIDGRYSGSGQRIRLSDSRYGGLALYESFHLELHHQQIKAKLADANVTLIALIDRIRMLDNDIIRLQQKLDTVIELREQKDEQVVDND